jgi:hypothetical protein
MLFTAAMTFFKAQWRVLIPLAMLMGALWYVHALRADKIAAVNELATYKVQQKQLADEQAKTNAANMDKARAKASLAEVVNNNQVNAILEANNETIQQLTDKLKGRYETKSNNYTLGAGTGIVLPRSNSSDPLAKTASDTQGLASGGAITDPACFGLRDELATLEEATAITTSDFNACMITLDADSLVLEREH